MEKVMVAEVEELPKAIVRRVVKDKLSQCSDDGDIIVHKDGLRAFCESARIFIHYLSATANDLCKESKRQTINADDVLKAVEEIEFPEFVQPLQASLVEFRKKKAGAAKVREARKRREDSTIDNEGGKGENEEGEEGDEVKDNSCGNDSHEPEQKSAGKKSGAGKSRKVNKKRKVEEEKQGDGESNEDEDESHGKE